VNTTIEYLFESNGAGRLPHLMFRTPKILSVRFPFEASKIAAVNAE
jgi:hypothetical protein